jgi:hypothetical protein
MEQIEDLDFYSCMNPKRRMTLISIREATWQQTRDPKIAEKEKKTFSSRSKKTSTTVQDLFLFSSQLFYFASMMFRILMMKFIYVIMSS